MAETARSSANEVRSQSKAAKAVYHCVELGAWSVVWAEKTGMARQVDCPVLVMAELQKRML